MSAHNGATTLFGYQVVILIFPGAGSGEERGSNGGGSSSFPAAADALYADGGERGVTVLQVRNPPSVALSCSHATR